MVSMCPVTLPLADDRGGYESDVAIEQVAGFDWDGGIGVSGVLVSAEHEDSAATLHEATGGREGIRVSGSLDGDVGELAAGDLLDRLVEQLGGGVDGMGRAEPCGVLEAIVEEVGGDDAACSRPRCHGSEGLADGALPYYQHGTSEKGSHLLESEEDGAGGLAHEPFSNVAVVRQCDYPIGQRFVVLDEALVGAGG